MSRDVGRSDDCTRTMGVGSCRGNRLEVNSKPLAGFSAANVKMVILVWPGTMIDVLRGDWPGV